MDPKIAEMLSTKSDTERMKVIAFSLACLCTGPTPYQPPDYCPRAAKGEKVDVDEWWQETEEVDWE